MYCIKCGAKNEEGNKFCVKCGYKFEKITFQKEEMNCNKKVLNRDLRHVQCKRQNDENFAKNSKVFLIFGLMIVILCGLFLGSKEIISMLNRETKVDEINKESTELEVLSGTREELVQEWENKEQAVETRTGQEDESESNEEFDYINEVIGSWYAYGSIRPLFMLKEDGSGVFGTKEINIKWTTLESNKLKIESLDGSDSRIIDIYDISDGVMRCDDDGYSVTYYNAPNYAYIKQSAREYHEGLAWIECSADFISYWICIDKSGTALFGFDASNIDEVKDFSSGYAYIEKNNTLYVINTDGDIQSRYAIEGDILAYAYGDGYVLTEELAEGFDNTEHSYIIHDYDGSVLLEFTLDSSIKVFDIKYLGSGVFGIRTDQGFNYFCTANGNEWIYNTMPLENIYFYGNTATVNIDYCDCAFNSDEDKRADLHLMDNTGNIQRVPLYLKYGSKWEMPIIVNEDTCILEDNSGNYASLSTYDIVNETFTKLDNKYLDKISWGELPKELIFRDERIVLPFKGMDENSYVGIFDTQWNTILEPVIAEQYYGIADGKLMVINGKDVTCYDGNGKILFNLTLDKNYRFGYYSDGAILMKEYQEENYVYPMDTPTYLDDRGEYLFSEINTNILEIKEIR